MHPLIQSAIISALPVAELRGGIPWALAHNIDFVTAFFVCVVINIIIIPIIFLFLDSVHKFLMKNRAYQRTFDRFLEKVRKRTHKKIERYGYLGLTFFVAIPLPVTGCYTGSLAAWFFGMNKAKSFCFIALGVLIAGIIVTAVALTGIEAFRFFLK